MKSDDPDSTARTAAGTTDEELVTITLPRGEWRALTSALRRDKDCQYQLGRRAWQTIATVEGVLACGPIERKGRE